MYIPPETQEVIDAVLNQIINQAWDFVSVYEKDADDHRKKAR